MDFKQCVCDCCHDLLQKSKSFDEVVIVTVRRNNLGFIFGVWPKGKGVCRIKISDLKEKSSRICQRKNWKLVLYLTVTPEIKSRQKEKKSCRK